MFSLWILTYWPHWGDVGGLFGAVIILKSSWKSNCEFLRVLFRTSRRYSD